VLKSDPFFSITNSQWEEDWNTILTPFGAGKRVLETVNSKITDASHLPNGKTNPTINSEITETHHPPISRVGRQ
ncbi:hypothetical protein GBAR_LOCUS25752, partial [Geodia barretti]